MSLRSAIFIPAFLSHCCLFVTPAPAENYYRNPFEQQHAKILIDTAHRKSSRLELAFLIDEECISRRNLPSELGTLAKSWNITLSPRRSTVQSHRVVIPLGSSYSLDWVESDPCVLGVAENRAAFSTERPDDPFLGKQEHLQTIQYLPAYAYFRGAIAEPFRPAVIAVIDSGLAIDHDDLRDNLWLNVAEAFGMTGVDDDSNGYVDDVHGFNFVSRIGDPSHENANDHGTHVAGLAAAVSGNGLGVAGVAGARARLMGLNVFGKNWGTETIYIDEAIRYAADNGAQIINISINGPGRSETTAAAITYALQKGVVVVVSAGNRSENIEKVFTFPASYAGQYPGLISVGAVDAKTQQRCEFSNHSVALVKIAAPGCDLLAPQKGIYSTRGRNLYGYKSGTSMAAPMVSGALALTVVLLQSLNGKSLSPAEIERTLLEGSEFRESLQNDFSAGRSLNLFKLMEALRPQAETLEP